MKVNVQGWKYFKLKDLFDDFTGGDLLIGEVETGGIPIASNSSENNNIAGYTSFIPNRKLFDHKISISIADRGKFWAFIQPKDFYIGTRVKALVCKYDKITINQLAFITTIINQESFKFCYGRNCCANLPDMIIKLPVKHNSNGTLYIDDSYSYSEEGFVPDWKFMEDYIKTLHYKPITTKNKSHSIDLNVQNWKNFSLISLFDHLESGKISNAGDLEEGNDLHYLGAKKDDNGVMQICSDIPEKRSRGNCVVMICDGQGSVGYANYMNKDFLGTVNLMLGYNDQHLNKYTGLFLATVLSQERPKYSFGRKWKTHIEETVIKLPAILNSKTNKYEPDWEFMENYIKSLTYGDRI